MCDERLNELCSIMLAQEARIRGRSQCFENDQEVCTVLPMLFTKIVVPDDIPMLLHQQVSVVPTKSVVQLIVPSLLNGKLKEDLQLPPIINPLSHTIIKPLTVVATKTPPPQTLTPTKKGSEQQEQTIFTTVSTTVPIVPSTFSSVTTLSSTVSTAPTSSKHSGEDQPLVLDIEEGPIRPLQHDESIGNVTLNGTDHALDLKVFNTNISQNVNREAEISSDTVTVAQTEYATVEYIHNLDELLRPPASSIHESLPPELKNVENNANLMKHDNFELEDSKSNSIHDEYSTVISAPDTAHSLILPENPPKTP